MNQTYYQYICKFVDPHADDPISRLANKIHKDIAFPKQSVNFEEISSYLEHSGLYGKLLVTFDETWQQFQYTN